MLGHEASTGAATTGRAARARGGYEFRRQDAGSHENEERDGKDL